ADWLDYAESLPAEDCEAAGAAKLELERAGLLQRYLLTDLADLSGLVAAARKSAVPGALETAERASRLHLTRLEEPAELAAVKGDLRELEKRAGIRHFVSSYRDEGGETWRQAAAEIAPDLRALKPLFIAAGHNFSRSARVLKAYVRDFLGQRGGSAPYLEALTHFLSRRAEILDRYRPEQRGALSLSEERARRWRQGLQDLEGHLPTEAAVSGAHPLPPAEGEAARSLCFNGPHDPASGVYAVTNVFAGDGQFIGRYHLDSDGANLVEGGAAAAAEEERPLDVEIAVPPVPNLNYVLPAYGAGTGFEARYSHRYRTWIEPEDLELALVAADGPERLVFRQRSTGRELRMRYRGTMLATSLPAEYQLLLLDHGDTFANPFLRGRRPGSGAETPHRDPELRIGRVLVRRESWTLGPELLRQAPRTDDPLLFTADFRDWLREQLGVMQDRWYFQTPGGAKGSYKPRFVDFRNPLSGHAFRRCLGALPATASLSFTQLDPAPERLPGRRVRELMIEV
ncbi:MAG: hypothetical protein AAF725_05570, partial [Acidobacteriota bacterium]